MREVKIDVPTGQHLLLIPGKLEEIDALFNAMSVLQMSVNAQCDANGRAAFLALVQMMQRARVAEAPQREFDA